MTQGFRNEWKCYCTNDIDNNMKKELINKSTKEWRG